MNKRMLRTIIPISLVVALAVGVPILSGCLPGQPAPAPEAPAPEAPKVVTAKIGFNAPLTGPVAGWGLPGLHGVEIWVEHFNAAGGITLTDGTQVLIELVPYDNEYSADKSLAGARKLVLEDEVVMVQHMGGGAAMAATPFYTEQKMLSTTLVPMDLSPETPYHIAPIEIWHLYGVSGIVWIAENQPEIKTIALSTQDDVLGQGFFASASAAAEAAGIEVVYAKFFDVETIDFVPVMSDLIAAEADCIGLYSYSDYITLMNTAAYDLGYEGLIYSVTFDFYDALIEKTSVEFMEGFIWLFPDFDDPALNPSPNPYTVIEPIDFWNEFHEKYPGTWSAVSWEYMEIMNTWKQGVIYADSIEPIKVLEALKAMPTIYNTFGEVTWWGEPLWGVDNALVGKWPVVQMQDGKGVIVDFVNQLDWWERNGEILIARTEEYGQMWYQIMGLTREEAIAQYPEAFE